MNRGIMLNIDDTHFIHSRWLKNIEPNRAEIERFVTQYADTQVTDLIFSVAGRIAGYPSKVTSSWIDKYLQKEENGLPVDYSATRAAVSYDMYVNRQLDPFGIWLSTCRRIGVRGWLSLRMNDCHDNDKPTSMLHSAFYHEHPECRRVTHRSVDGYFDRCMDYAEPEVRKRRLAIIDEILDRYDMDGIELDWMREAFCFRPGGEYEGIEIINEFMREVSSRVQKAAERRGHAILLSARVPADPEDALEMGFDAAQWAREGLVQALIPSPRWRTCDTDIPVGMWKRLLAGTGVMLAPCIEILMQPGNRPRLYAHTEHVTALAEQHFALGGDRTYLFNYFDDPTPEDSYWAASTAAHPDMGVKKENQDFLLKTIGDPDSTQASARRHLVTERDLRPEWRQTEHVLPMALQRAGSFKQVRLCIGRVSGEQQVTLVLGLSQGRAEDLTLFANRQSAALVGETQVRPGKYLDHAAYAFSVPNDGKLPVYLVLEISTQGGLVEVDYIEVQVSACPK